MTQVVDLSARTRAAHRAPSPAVLALAVDLLVIGAAGAAGLVGRSSLAFFEPGRGLEASLRTGGPVIVAVVLAAIAALGGYDRDRLGPGTDQFKCVLNAGFVAAAVTGIGCYLLQFELSRGFFMLAFGIGVPGLLLGRFALRTAVFAVRRRGHWRQTVLVSGTPAHVDELAGVLRRETWLGYEVLGALVPATATGPETSGGVPVVGRSEDAVEAVERLQPDVLLLADGAAGSCTVLRRVVWALEGSHTDVVVAPSVADVSRERVKMRPVGGLPLIHIDKPRTIRASRSAKRLFDLVGAVLLIVAFLPVLAVAAVSVWAHDRGPVLFSHVRVGRDGRSFRCLKFRTMVPDADRLLAELRDATGSSALLFKLKDDPRVTRPGGWLRRFSLDELPQLFNVVRGEMSLVGPRPQVPDEVALYDDGMQRRLLVRPGMTGLWQVSGRSDLSSEEAVRLDLFYVDNWSMLQDLSILARTAGAVLGRRGAY